MRNNIHGLLSLGFVAAAMIMALVVILNHSSLFGAIYAVLLLISGPLIIYAYCAKCPVRLTGCRHIFPGPATRFMPERPQKPYGILDYSGVAIPFSLLLIIPHYWLIRSLPALVLFWLLLIIGFIEIWVFVCKGCENKYCPMTKLRS